MRNGLFPLLQALMAFLLLLNMLASPRPAAAEQPRLPMVRDQLKKRLTAAELPAEAKILGEFVHSLKMTAKFYERRDFQPAWLGLNGQFPRPAALIKAIREVSRDGLVPEYYHLKAIESSLAKLQTAQGQETTPDYALLADLDVLLTDSFFLLSCHLANGCINPLMLEAQWFAGNEKMDVPAVLEKALQENRVKESLDSLAPREGFYPKLRQALAQYREKAAKETWSVIADGPKLRQNDKDKRIPALRQRLAVLGDLAAGENMTAELFDERFAEAVQRFQQRHGLTADGVIGPKTLQALNISPQKRIRQIELNMERLRWSLRNPGPRYILVNIANFGLEVIENGSPVLSMRVVVGKPFWNTPVFSEEMTYLVLNPPWHIPKSIALEEILPKLRKDPGYLDRQDIKVSQNGATLDGKALQQINWSRLSINNFPYKFKQNPGPKNPLGSIKFVFPNQHDIYLHDSPNKNLFQRNIRAYSHGCIRIEKPVELAEYLLRDDPKWNRDAIAQTIKNGEKKTIRLPRPVPVHLLYLTAWVDENNIMQFRDDIYERDALLDEALSEGHLPGQ
ncbi:MAG: L,D-transpeptidase family protein [Deltaproteobacteria bacterium]|nr:L,D-transpeptidase family protein [Deltaproteobacteria bacterium]